jgi:hypothetical protein
MAERPHHPVDVLFNGLRPTPVDTVNMQMDEFKSHDFWAHDVAAGSFNIVSTGRGERTCVDTPWLSKAAVVCASRSRSSDSRWTSELICAETNSINLVKRYVNPQSWESVRGRNCCLATYGSIADLSRGATEPTAPVTELGRNHCIGF